MARRKTKIRVKISNKGSVTNVGKLGWTEKGKIHSILRRALKYT